MTVKKIIIIYRISTNSLRGNLWSQYIKVWKLFKGGNNSREETIQGKKLFKGGNWKLFAEIRYSKLIAIETFT